MKNTKGTEMSHTPGPWSVNVLPYYSHADKRGYIGYIVRQEGMGKNICCDSGSGPLDVPDTHQEGNAYLIGAAPEMLEALRDMLGYFTSANHNWEQHYEVIDRALAVVGVATGKSVEEVRIGITPKATYWNEALPVASSDYDKRVPGVWYRIETAPQDGTVIDLCADMTRRIADCRWSKEQGVWILPSGWAVHGGASFKVESVTHWTPIIKPPIPTP